MSAPSGAAAVGAKRELLARVLRERSRRRRREPLSHAQRRLWFVQQLDPASPAYNLPVSIVARGTLDVRAVRRAFNGLVHRHEILRTTFPATDGEPVQEIAPHTPLVLPLVDVSALPEAMRAAAMRRLAHDEAHRPFDLTTEAPIRVTLIREDEHHHELLFTLHHIATDGWSLGILIREFTALYRTPQDQPSPLPELTLRYSDFARWQQKWLAGRAVERDLQYWRETLAGMSRTELPADRRRSATTGRTSAVSSIEFPAGLSKEIRAFVQREGVTLFMCLAAAFSIVLSKHARQSDVSIGILVANRNRRETEDLVGFFANTVVLRTLAEGRRTFREYLRSVRTATLDAQVHQDLPFDVLVERLEPARDPQRSPLFQSLFALQNANAETLTIPGVELEVKTNLPGMAKLDWEMAIYDTFPALTGDLEYCTDLFAPRTMERFVQHMQTVLASAIANPDRPLAAIPLLTPAEQEAMLGAHQGAVVDCPSGQVQDQIARQAARTPDAIAATAEGEAITYGALNARANQLAHRLIASAVGPGDLVAVLVPRSLDSVIALLGCLKAGAAYVPLDPAYPRDRLQGLLDSTRVPVLLTRAALANDVSFGGGERIFLDRDDAIAAQPAFDPVRPSHDRDLAYMVYTSGSTGRPKGVMIEHGGFRNHLWAKATDLSLTASDVVAATASVSFDISIWQFLAALLVGGSTRIFSDDVVLQASGFLAHAEARGVTVIQTVPSWLAGMLEGERSASRRLRLMISNAEPLTDTLCRRWRETCPHVPLVNMYGPTECSDDVVHWRVDAGTTASMPWAPLGFALPNTELYVLDENGSILPPGIAGELHIGGAGVGRGYADRPDLTARTFVPHPFSRVPGSRLYRTGDLVRRMEDGNLEFLERLDHQVKIRGNRVELGEIEAALRANERLAQTVVVARGADAIDRHLVAYVVPAAGAGASLRHEDLRASLERVLPAYMIPTAFVVMSALPLNANGKIDRRALPAPDLDAEAAAAARPYELPRTPIEEVVAGIWERVLSKTRIGRSDNFFALGGHSLLATQVISRVNGACGVDVPLRTLFDAPTVAGLAAHVEQLARGAARSTIPPIARASRDQAAPLSFAQQRLWFLEQLNPGAATYHMTYALRLTGPLDAAALWRSFNHLVERHEALRTRFPMNDGRAVQEIAPASRVPRTLVDVATLRDPLAAARRIAIAAATARFDLERGPLMRVLLARLGPGDHVLLLTLHHIISDGWSMGVLMRELGVLYPAYRPGTPAIAVLPSLPIGYVDYASWQRQWLRGEVLDDLLAYWRTVLADVEPLMLNTEGPRPAQTSHDAAIASRRLGSELTDALRRFSREQGATAFMVLLAAFQVLLSRHTGQPDIVVGSVTANRNRKDIEPVIGFFVNMLPLRTTVDRGATFAQLVAAVRDTCLQAYAHQDLPFEKLVDELGLARDASRHPLVQVTFAVDDEPDAPVVLPGLDVTGMPNQAERTRFDLECYVSTAEDGYDVRMLYDRELFTVGRMRDLLERYHLLLTAAMAAPDAAIETLCALDDRERHQVLVEWNNTAHAYPDAATIHGLIAEQAARTPAATALVFAAPAATSGMPPISLTYRELNERANQWAWHLRRLGVGPEVRVALHLERSVDLVVAVLAVLKAGGAYVPLDPGYPADRLSFMVVDAGARVLLTQRHLQGTEATEGTPGAFIVPPDVVTVFVEDADNAGDAGASAAGHAGNPPALATAANVAYVIYTSGSTGRPKGVVNTHGGVVNRLCWMQSAYGLTSRDAVLQKTPFSFDVSVWELFWPLQQGARLVVAQPDGHRDPAYLEAAIAAHGVTTMHFVPSMLQAFVKSADASRCGSLTRVICSGEALPASLVARFYARFPEPVTLHNLYGPTEAAVDASYWACPRSASGGVVPIGAPVWNTQLYVLDAEGRPVPQGAAGELFIGGVQVARGYVGQAALTAARFVPNPFGGMPGATAGGRLYRTGDCARWRADGTLEYLGRLDAQVKIRGVRIELGEIDSVLRRHPGVTDCVVMVQEDAVREPRLIAYITGGAAPGALREWLRAQVPEQMVPAAIVRLEALPLSPNGKVDRRALPAPEYVDHESAVAPRTPSERLLAGIWAEVLRLERVGVHDNFFNLGGDSILSIQVVARAQQAGVHLTARHLFSHQTIAELAAVVESASPSDPESALPGGPVSLTPIQRAFFAHPRASPHHFNQSVLLAACVAIDVPQLARAIEIVAGWHDGLRFRFTRHGGASGGWTQHYAARSEAAFGFSEIDLRQVPAERWQSAIEAASAAAQRSLDLEHGPLLRAVWFAGGEDRSRLLIVIHHLVIDAISWRILLDDLQRVYSQLAAGNEAIVPARRTTAFGAWAARLADEAQRDHVRHALAHWTARSARRPLLRLCHETRDTGAAHDTGDVRAARGARAGSQATVRSQLSGAQTRALLRQAPQVHGAQIQELLLAAVAEALSRWAGPGDLLIDVEGHGREEDLVDQTDAILDLSRTIGWFTTQYPVLLPDTGGRGAASRVARVREALRDVPRRGFDYGLLRYLHDNPDVRGALENQPAAEIRFNYLGQFDQTLDPAGPFQPASEWTGPPQDPDNLLTHAIDISAVVTGGCLTVMWNYSADIYTRGAIETLSRHCLDELRALVAAASSSGPDAMPWSPMADVGERQMESIVEQLRAARGAGR